MSHMPFCKTLLATVLSAACCVTSVHAAPATTPKAPEQNNSKPNIVVIFGDDIGYWNLSTYNQGMMGYKTPNIDSIAAEGAKFTSYYAEQSSTAGRSAFITGQMPFRTGLSKVGMPGAPQGIQKKILLLPASLSSWAMPPGSLVKITSAIAMSFCLPHTGLMSLWATSITLMPKRSRKILTTLQIRLSANSLARAAY